MANYDIIFDKILKKEGGFQNMSSDEGNYCNGNLIGTKWGVSAIAYKEFYGKCPSVSEMRNLTQEEAKNIWKSTEWDKIKGDLIESQSVAELILDSVSGGANGFLHTRQAINESSGKKLVPENKSMKLSQSEVDYINSIDDKKYFDSLYNIRLNYFKSHPQYKEYGVGWINRLNKVYNSFSTKAKSAVKDNPIKTIIAIITIAAIAGYWIYIGRKEKII